MTGECYAGHYIPVVAEYLLKSGFSKMIRFKGIAIGNGWYIAS